MKKLIFTTAFTLTIASLNAAVYASAIPHNLIASNVHGNAHPSSARVQNATHHFEIIVPQPGLSALSIEIPESISIREGIEVKNQAGQIVDAQVSINDKKATVTFTQPVLNPETLSIYLRGVNTPGYAQTWLYRMDGKLVDLNTEIPLGVARIATYGDN